MPKQNRPATVMSASATISAMPMFMLVYLRTIIAMMSVPPLEAFRLNRIAEPNAGSRTAKHSSSSGWLVSG